MNNDELLKSITAFIETKKKGDKDCYQVVTQLWQLILEKADVDSTYKTQLLLWISGEESTVFLRDVLASPFQDHDFNVDIWSPFDNAWISLDSWGAEIIKQQDMSPIDREIILGNGEKIIYSHHCFFSNPIYKRENGKYPRMTIIDDVITSVTVDDEPCCPIKQDLQPAIFQTHTYSFSKGRFEKRASEHLS